MLRAAWYGKRVTVMAGLLDEQELTLALQLLNVTNIKEV